MVKTIEVDVCKELAGEIANGESHADFLGVKEGFAISPAKSIPVAGKYPPDEIKHLLIGHYPFDGSEQNFMIDVWEIALDVTLQHIRKTPRKLGRTPHPCMGALAGPTGEAVFNKPRLEDRLENPHQRVMHDAVPKRSRSNNPLFGFINLEVGVATRSVNPGDEFFMQTPYFGFQRA